MMTPEQISSAKIDLELDSFFKFDAVSFTEWKQFHTFINRKSLSYFLVDNEHYLKIMRKWDV